MQKRCSGCSKVSKRDWQLFGAVRISTSHHGTTALARRGGPESTSLKARHRCCSASTTRTFAHLFLTLVFQLSPPDTEAGRIGMAITSITMKASQLLGNEEIAWAEWDKYLQQIRIGTVAANPDTLGIRQQFLAFANQVETPPGRPTFVAGPRDYFADAAHADDLHWLFKRLEKRLALARRPDLSLSYDSALHLGTTWIRQYSVSINDEQREMQYDGFDAVRFQKDFVDVDIPALSEGNRHGNNLDDYNSHYASMRLVSLHLPDFQVEISRNSGLYQEILRSSQAERQFEMGGLGGGVRGIRFIIFYNDLDRIQQPEPEEARVSDVVSITIYLIVTKVGKQNT
ncbi:unnamed protein product [Amoebophrya sp. A120]|nr:unnamed protein product [Amoebophrya sp. A120]|eukprot:GSA120T00014721001.1